MLPEDPTRHDFQTWEDIHETRGEFKVNELPTTLLMVPSDRIFGNPREETKAVAFTRVSGIITYHQAKSRKGEQAAEMMSTRERIEGCRLMHDVNRILDRSNEYELDIGQGGGHGGGQGKQRSGTPKRGKAGKTGKAGKAKPREGSRRR